MKYSSFTTSCFRETVKFKFRQSQREELILCQILFIFVLEFVFTTAVLKDV